MAGLGPPWFQSFFSPPSSLYSEETFPFLRPRLISRINSVRLLRYPTLCKYGHGYFPAEFCGFTLPCHCFTRYLSPTSQLQCPKVLLCIGVNGFQCPSGYGGVKECLGEGNKGHCDLEMPMWLGWSGMGVKLSWLFWDLFEGPWSFWNLLLQCFWGQTTVLEQRLQSMGDPLKGYFLDVFFKTRTSGRKVISVSDLAMVRWFCC